MPITVPLLGPIDHGPTIDRSKVPPDEREAVLHIQSLLVHLAHYERQFRLAVALFNASTAENQALVDGSLSRADFLQACDTLDGWKRIAARDGSLSAHHFGWTLKSISSNAGRSRVFMTHFKSDVFQVVLDSFTHSHSFIKSYARKLVTA